MAGYSFREQVDVTFAYFRANGSGRDAARFYHEIFPDQSNQTIKI
jgi:predicted 3-demethylubiquinone-9 3-methyltransferase (glyoxalase superfamily)